VTVSCLEDAVSLIGATPTSPYVMSIESEGPERVRVEFESSETEWRVEATCRDGVMSSTVEEN